jgi:UMF1 family MFS transporter
MNSRTRAPKREIFGWAMFDFANSAYTLLIITVVFGDLYTRVIVGDAPDYRLGNLLWSISLATSYLLVVICAPVAGAIMDATASKKRFLFASYLLTIITTAMLYFVAPGWVMLGVILIILSNFAYSIGEAFIASFLPDLGPPEDLGRISGFGWALGYIGGLVSALFVLFTLGEVSSENFERIRWVGPWTAFFFMISAIPTFLWLKERGTPQARPADGNLIMTGIGRIRDTLSRIREKRDLAILLVSVFFSMAGIYIIITYAFIYGAQVIRWDEHVRVLMFVLLQITAAGGSFLFGFVGHRIGTLQTYRLTLVLWISAIVLIFLTPLVPGIVYRLAGLEWQAQYIFLVVSCIAGMSLGACQSTTRALVGLFSPLARSAEFFGFWALSMKLAGMCGLLSMGVLQLLLGLERAILFCALLFTIALVVSLYVNEQRGRAAAEVNPG